MTRRELEPVVALIDNYCVLRGDRDPAADRLVLGGTDLRKRLPRDCMRMTLEDVTYASDTSAAAVIRSRSFCGFSQGDIAAMLFGAASRTGRSLDDDERDCRPCQHAREWLERLFLRGIE